MIPLPPEMMTSTELGFTRVASRPAKNWHCQSLASRGDLLIVMIGQSITLYRKTEGIFVSGRVDLVGLTPKQVRALAEDENACAKWNLADWSPNYGERYDAFTDPELIEWFDHAEENPQAFFDRVQVGPPYFSRSGYKGGQLTAITSRREIKSRVFLEVLSELQGLRASDLFRDLASVRQSMTPQALAATRSAQLVAVQDAKRQRAVTAQAALQAFVAATSRPKQVGATVCSADNRIAYVEQVAGARIKLAVRGRLLARERQFGELGPYDLDYSVAQFGGTEDLPVEDPHFLFHRLPGTFSLSKEATALWDESRFWGECDHR